jgi:hypothetical protein
MLVRLLSALAATTATLAFATPSVALAHNDVQLALRGTGAEVVLAAR